MKKIITGILCCLLAVFVMSHNTYAFAPGQSLRARYSFFLSHNANQNMITNTGDGSDPNNYTVLNNFHVNFNTAYIEDGEIVDLTLVLTNKSLNNSADINFAINDVRCNDWGINCMLLGYDGENVNASMGIIHIYIQVNQTTSAFGSIDIYFNSLKSTLYGQETLTAQNIVFYHQTGYDLSSGFSSLHTDLQAINSALNTQTTYLSSLLSNSYENFNFYGGFNIRLNTIIDSLSSLDDIADSTQNISDYVDEQRQAYENMQDTDGLIDIGDQTQALSIVGSINSVLGQVNAIPAAANCVLAGDLGVINLGNLDFCQGKENFAWIVTFVATGIFLVISFFICIRVIKKVLRVISWARRN